MHNLSYRSHKHPNRLTFRQWRHHQFNVSHVTTRLFHSMAAAEDPYRQQLQRNKTKPKNNILTGKLDELIGSKLDNIAVLLERVVAAPPSANPSTSAVPASAIAPSSATPHGYSDCGGNIGPSVLSSPVFLIGIRVTRSSELDTARALSSDIG